MSKTVIIGAGGALGALLRYFVGLISTSLFGTDYPWGTVIVNLVGAFLIGFLWGLFQMSNFSDNLKNFVFVGLIGSFTTFSTLSLDAFNLFKAGSFRLGFYHLFVTNVLGLVFVAVGYLLATRTHQIISVLVK